MIWLIAAFVLGVFAPAWVSLPRLLWQGSKLGLKNCNTLRGARLLPDYGKWRKLYVFPCVFIYTLWNKVWRGIDIEYRRID